MAVRHFGIDEACHDLLPENRGVFYSYEGSLTTKADEDNDETVSWVIFREPMWVDRDTLGEFVGLGHQAKKSQELNRWFVFTSFVPPG
ncbi:MAG: carbonic anhydrase family protein [Gemmataceae bacterium]|nr:carbonic anhydrase family protein [Gemmataceae bacterium]